MTQQTQSMTFFQRSWRRFRQHPLAFWSLRILVLLSLLCAFCPMLCNEKPLLVSYRGHVYVPFLSYVPETVFGGDFDLEADYRNPEFTETVKASGGWILWPILRQSPDTIDWTRPCPTAPNADHWLGTDDQGRDVFVRLIYALRISLFFGSIVSACIIALSLFAGCIQGYFGGLIDLIGQRLIELWSGLPILFVLMIISSLVQPHLGWLILLVVFLNWFSLANLTRAEFLRTRRLAYVQAAQVLGASSFSIMLKHILPNALVALITYLPFVLSQSITLLVSLDFLGFGLPSGTPSLGEMLEQGKQNLYAPWLGLSGFLGMGSLLVLITFIGEGLRDAFDTRQ